MNSVSKILEYYRFEPEEKKQHLESFLSCPEEYSYYSLDIEKREFLHVSCERVGSSKSHQNLTEMTEARRTAVRLLGLLNEPEKGIALYDLIFPKLPAKSVNPDDLTVSLKMAKNNQQVDVSLPDYIHTLLSAEDSVAPDKTLILFHKFLLGRLRLPKFLITNANYK